MVLLAGALLFSARRKRQRLGRRRRRQTYFIGGAAGRGDFREDDYTPKDTTKLPPDIILEPADPAEAAAEAGSEAAVEESVKQDKSICLMALILLAVALYAAWKCSGGSWLHMLGALLLPELYLVMVVARRLFEPGYCG